MLCSALGSAVRSNSPRPRARSTLPGRLWLSRAGTRHSGGTESASADHIISGLPYRNMTDSLRREILDESRLALSAEGSMLLFQYTRTLQPYLESSFGSVKLNFQFFNILPALIFHCTP